MIIGDRRQIKTDNENLRLALEWLNNTDLAATPVGVYEIKGKDVFVQVQSYVPKKYENGKFETHKLYADVQMVVEGQEVMYASTDTSLCATSEGYKEDIEFYTGEPKTKAEIMMEPNLVCVLYPEDFHKPSIERKGVEAKEIKKIVVKIRV